MPVIYAHRLSVIFGCDRERESGKKAGEAKYTELFSSSLIDSNNASRKRPDARSNRVVKSERTYA